MPYFYLECSFVLEMGQFLSIHKTMRMSFPLYHLCLNDTFLQGSQSVVKDVECCAEGSILCLQGSANNLSQSMKFITHKQTDNEMRAFSWNHRPDASMVYFHYGSLNSVKAFMMAGRETCKCICSHVLFFLFFPKLWEDFNWQIQQSPISPGISCFPNLRRQPIFAKYFEHTK